MSATTNPPSWTTTTCDDLVKESKRHLAFLRRLHAGHVTFPTASALAVTTHRYVDCWLPLVVAAASSSASESWSQQPQPQPQEPLKLIPPPDIAWIWHCHRLAPARYRAYCAKRDCWGIGGGGRILEANPPFSFQEEQKLVALDNTGGGGNGDDDDDDACFSCETKSAKQTVALWKERYPDEPFWMEATAEKVEHKKNITPACSHHHRRHHGVDHDKKFLLDGFDIAASVQCQANFLWQVSGPRFADDDFLQEGVRRYFDFLRLESSLPLVPTYQIDLVWHTHMLVSSQGYHDDCVAIRGRPFHHDDSLNDRSEGSSLNQAFAATLEVWKRAHPDTPYIVEGGMYRGEPPSVYYDTAVWTPELGLDGGDRWMMLQNLTSTTTTTTTGAVTVGGSSSSGKDVAVWEVHTDQGWQPYPAQPQRDLEGEYEKLQSTCRVLAKIRNYNYEINVVAMTQTNLDVTARTRREIRRQPQGTWECRVDQAWRAYGTSDAALLEQAYQRCQNMGKVHVQTADWLYEVNIKAMTQTNVTNSKQRQVRRSLVTGANTSIAPIVLGTPLPVQLTSASARPWVDPRNSSAIPRPFIAAQAKSTQKGVNSNAKLQDYVFGKGSMGNGYYSLETIDAYKILYVRLKRREAHAKAQLDSFECDRCLCCGGIPTQAQIQEKNRMIEKWEDMRNMAAFCRAKTKAAGPDAAPGQGEIQKSLAASSSTRNPTYTSDRPNSWFYTDAYICTAGACGAGVRGSDDVCWSFVFVVLDMFDSILVFV